MIKIAFSTSFNRAFKKYINLSPENEKNFWEKMYIFQNNPYDKRLRTHKLTGRLSHLWSFSVSYSIRVVFQFETTERIILIDIGSHDEVY